MIPPNRAASLIMLMALLGTGEVSYAVEEEEILRRRVPRHPDPFPPIDVVRFKDLPKPVKVSIPLSQHVNGRKRLTRKQRKACR